MGLRARLLLLGVILVMPIMLLMGYQTWYFAQDKIEEETNNASHLVALIAQTEESQLAHYRKLLTALALSPAIADPANQLACHQRLVATTAINEPLSIITLYSAEGEVICSSATTPRAGDAERAFIAEALRHQTARVSDYLPGQSGKIAIALPLLDQQKKARAVLAADLDLTWLDSAVGKLALPAGTIIGMVDAKGTILVPKLWSGQAVAGHPVFNHIANSTTGSTFKNKGSDGIERIFVAQQLQTTSGGPAYIWAAIPLTNTLINTAVNDFLYQTLIVLAVIIVILMLIWRTALLWIFQPIERLRASAALLGKGLYATRTNLPHSADEIGQLTASIDDMAAAIETSECWRNMVLDSAQLGAWDLDLATQTVTRSLRHDQIYGYEALQPEWNTELFFKHTLPEDREHIRHCYEEAIASGRHHLETRIVRADGAIRWIHVQGQVQYDEQGQPVRMLGVVGDITERKRAEAELKKLNRTLRMVSQCNETLVRVTEEAELLETICRHIVDSGGYRLAWAGFALHDAGKSVQPAASYGECGDYLEDLQITWADERRGRGPIGKAIREGRPVVAHDTQTDPNFAPWRDNARQHGFASTIALPLKSKGGVIGTLCIYAAETGAFDDEEIGLLEKLADDLAYGITNLREVTKREGFERQLDYQASYDNLTGLANRVLFIDRLNQSMLYAGRNDRLVAVLLIDLDRFKTINDSLGHAVGDQVLMQTGERLTNALRDGDTVARLSVDEFGVILSDVAIAEDVVPLTHKLLQMIAQPLTLEGQEIFVTGSAGISFYPKDDDNPESLLQAAYSAMHSAKSLGGNNFHFYSRDMNQRVSLRLALDGALRRALDHHELLVHYQPKVSLITGQIMGAEALVRWPHPEMGMIPPVDFIPLAEETGMIVKLGEWVLNHVCQQMRSWIDAGVPVQPVAVNLSARQFRQENLTQMVRQALLDNDLDPRLLELEITESTAMFDVEKAVIILQELKAIGVKLSLDDFGTGYSSLSYLKRFPIDHLKIDRAFVRDITFDPDDAAICSAVIGLAHNLKMTVIAEGVETEGQMNYLRQNQCDEMQGYFFSRPVPGADYERLLTQRKSLKLK